MLYLDQTFSSWENVPDTSSFFCRPTATISAFSRLRGAAMESTKEIMSLRASSDTVAMR